MEQNKEKIEEIKDEEIAALSHDDVDDNSGNIEDPMEDVDHSDEMHAEEIESEDSEDSVSDSDQEDRKSKKQIPEWAQKNPAAWGKRMAQKAKKEAEKEYSQKIKDLEEKLAATPFEPPLSDAEKDYIDNNDSKYLFRDPKNPNIILDIRTPEGEAAADEARKELLEKKRQEHEEQINLKKLKEKALNAQKEIENRRKKLGNAIIEASKKNPSIAQSIDKSFSNCKNSVEQIVDFVSTMRSNGPEFMDYLSRNPKELDRITSLSSADQHSELLRHHLEFHNRISPSNAPPPRTSEGASVVKSGHNKADIERMQRARYNMSS